MTRLPVSRTRIPRDVDDIKPNDNHLPGINQLEDMVGSGLSVGLILCAAALVCSAAVWAFGALSSNPTLASRGKVGVLVSCGAALVIGGAVALVQFFEGIGDDIKSS